MLIGHFVKEQGALKEAARQHRQFRPTEDAMELSRKPGCTCHVPVAALTRVSLSLSVFYNREALLSGGCAQASPPFSANHLVLARPLCLAFPVTAAPAPSTASPFFSNFSTVSLSTVHP